MGWNSVEATNLTWQHLEEVEKILSASPFSLYIINIIDNRLKILKLIQLRFLNNTK